jgi:hypothetical protein
MHIFWIAGLILAFIEFPDFGGSLGRIASSVERIAEATTDQPPSDPQLSEKDEQDEDRHGKHSAIKEANGGLEIGPREVARV